MTPPDAEPTTKELEAWESFYKPYLDSQGPDSATARICRLITEVAALEAKRDRLEAELRASAKNVLSPSREGLGTKIERVTELEAEVERLRGQLERQRPIVRKAQPRPYEND